MLSLRFLLMKLLLLNSVSWISSLHTKNLNREISLGPKTYLAGLTMYNTTLNYVACEDIDPSRKKCDLVVETHEFTGFLRRKSCLVSVHSKENHTLHPVARTFSFGKDEIIIAWGETHDENESPLLKINVVHPHDCRKGSIEIPVYDKSHDIGHVLERLLVLPHLDSYEAIYYDKEVCNRVCSVIFNSEGLTDGPSKPDLGLISKRPKEFVFPYQSNPNLRELGHCFTSMSEERLDASLIFTQHMRRTLYAETNKFRRTEISTAHGNLTLCKQESYDTNYLNCSQGNLKSWFNLTFPYNFQDSLIYNSGNGGILVFTGRKEQSEQTSYYKFSVTAFDNEKRAHKGVYVARSKCSNSHSRLHVNIFENESNEYCISFFERAHSARFIAKCFSRDFFMEESS
ncbi:hypothetical protein QAD02_008881 [Eretmocerus hayati]|uniref:Uncharacterized protein n=1 Tax=Eretmocerus hayati TaxID=131215 RepID=A0ACC2NA56_9HYME|nr:hypothetical protein QAD02_008881 [Eretmocerus hayati]